jgi:hypothetical protein
MPVDNNKRLSTPDAILHPYLDTCCCCHEDLSQTRDTQCHIGLTTPSHVESVEGHLRETGHITVTTGC